MRNLTRLLILALGFTFLLFNSSYAAAGTYIGEVCWNVANNDPSEGQDIIKLGISEEGDGHLTANGLVFTEGEGGDDTNLLLTGNIEVMNGIIILGLSGIQTSDDEITSIDLTIKLGPNSFDGNFAGIGTSYDRIGDESFTAAVSGTVAYRVCP